MNKRSIKNSLKNKSDKIEIYDLESDRLIGMVEPYQFKKRLESLVKKSGKAAYAWHLKGKYTCYPPLDFNNIINPPSLM